MKNLLLYCVLLLVIITSSYGQENKEICGTTAIDQYLQKKDPFYKKKRQEIEKEMQAYLTEREKSGMVDTIVTIPVVVHVLYNAEEENLPDSLIQSQIDVMNAEYRMQNEDLELTPDHFKDAIGDMRIEFELAKRDPEGNPTNGITRTETKRVSFPELGPQDEDRGFTFMHYDEKGGKDAWDTKSYLNIWTVNLQGGNTLAWAYLPGASEDVDGIVCRYNYFGRPTIAGDPYELGRTMTHEVGHWLNLFHVFNNDGAGCSQDYVDDTPPQREANFNCPSFPRSTCGNHSDMFMNFMDYANDACSYMFTKGQAKRSHAAIAVSRPGLYTSLALSPIAENDVQVSSIINPEITYCYGDESPVMVEIKNTGSNTVTSLQLSYQLNDGEIKTYDWEGSLAPGATDFVIPDVVQGQEGLNNITAFTSLPNGEKDAYPHADTVRRAFTTKSAMSLPYLEDFEEPFTEKGWDIIDSDGAIPWQYIVEVMSSDSTVGGAVAVNHGFHTFFDIANSSYDELISPLIDLSTVTQPYLVFDYSYYSGNFNAGTIRLDNLSVIVSTDCGAINDTVFFKSVDGLRTRETAMVQEATDWGRDTIDLTAFEGKNIQLTFRTESDGGYWLLLDNVQVDGIPNAVGFDTEALFLENFDCHPNPVQNVLTIDWEVKESQELQLNLYGIDGQQLLTQSMEATQIKGQTEMDMTVLPAGIYLLELKGEEGSKVIKVVKE